jgi:hypothetical protein
MMLTASLELGPNRWVPAVLEAGGIPGILVLVWVTGLMAVLRFFCGPVVRFFSDTGLLLVSAIVGGVGLLALSFSSDLWMVAISATVFAFGVCYFWPTMLGTVAERVPKGGALALALLGGMGSLFVNTVTTPLMGYAADVYLHRELVAKGTADGVPMNHERETVEVLQKIDTTYAAWEAALGMSRQDDVTRREIAVARADVGAVLRAWQANGFLPEIATANALRSAIKNGPGGSEGAPAGDAERAALEAKQAAAAILNPADNKGGLIAFRWVAPISIVLALVFGAMYFQDRRRRAKH